MNTDFILIHIDIIHFLLYMKISVTGFLEFLHCRVVSEDQ